MNSAPPVPMVAMMRPGQDWRYNPTRQPVIATNQPTVFAVVAQPTVFAVVASSECCRQREQHGKSHVFVSLRTTLFPDDLLAETVRAVSGLASQHAHC